MHMKHAEFESAWIPLVEGILWIKTAVLALLGPAGWAYLFGSGSIGKQRPCDAALKIAGEGTPRTAAKSEKVRPTATNQTKRDGDAPSADRIPISRRR